MAHQLSILCCALLGVAAASYIPHGGYSHEHGVGYSIQTHHEAPKQWQDHHQAHHQWVDAPKAHSWGTVQDHHHQQWAPVAAHDSHHQWSHHEEPKHHPKYEFNYGVKDTKTGDIKQQWETRDGDKVKGGYTMKEADGRTRIVEYTADAHNGFQATVKHVGHASHLEHNSHSHGQQYGHGHGHATSYVDVKQDTGSKWEDKSSKWW
ncbi:histidine-rich glycoprotein [Drosophila sechellia]|uniref:GM18103 n=1 Tax=Drosophila sechellia TaxID=7238 RepID=B4IIL4_DROSE|nr:histidine-rich glycoprotein [Drosophila sechellia]EDW49785.1 GM18103 [Drosophila sechellia]